MHSVNLWMQHHAVLHRFTECIHASLPLEVRLVPKGLLNLVAHLLIDAVGGVNTINVGQGIFNDLSILQVDSSHFNKISSVSAVMSDELGHHCHWLVCVNLKIFSWPEIFLIPKSPVVEITPVFITDTFVSFITCIVSTINTFTSHISNRVAGVGTMQVMKDTKVSVIKT